MLSATRECPHDNDNAPATRIATSFAAAILLVACFAYPAAAYAQTQGEGATTESASPPPAPTLPVASSPLASQEAPPAAARPSEGGACGTAGLQRVAQAARRGTVRITTHTRWGAGFLIDDTHVVTHFSVVERPFQLRVHALDDLSIGAKVVFIDAFERIAILELDAPIPGKALELATSAPVIGSDIVAIGVPIDFGTREDPFPAQRRGVISDSNDDLMTTDALVGNNNYTGGPLFDCQGHVVGILIPAPSGRPSWETPMAHAVPVTKIREARANAEKKPYQQKPGFVLGFQTMFVGQFERGKGFVGGTLGVPLLFAEQWEFLPRFGALAQVPANGDPKLPIGRTDRGRFTGDLRLSYRIPLVSAPATISLVPSIGAGWNWELTQATTYNLVLDDPTCAGQPKPCSFQMIEHEQDSWQQANALFLGLSVHVSAAVLGYELRVLPSSDMKFIHQVSLGVATF